MTDRGEFGEPNHGEPNGDFEDGTLDDDDDDDGESEGDGDFEDEDEDDEFDSSAAPQRRTFPEPGVPRSARVLALLAMAMLFLVFGTGVARLAAEIDRLTVARAAVVDPALGGQAERSDQVALVFTGAWSVTVLLAGVAFILWLRRVRANGGIWSPPTMRLRRGWAIWGWFVPVVSLWFPYVIAQDALTAARIPPVSAGAGRGLLRVWWTTWVLTLLAGLAELAEDGRRTLGRDEIRVAAIAVVATAIGLLAAVAAILVVRSLTEAQEERLRWVLPPEIPAGREGSPIPP